MPRALLWKTDKFSYDVCAARKPNAVRGQYRIFRDSGRYAVWHRKLNSVNGEMPERLVGNADTLEQAQALAQADDDRCRT